MAELRGERVVLRPLRRADAAALRAIRADPEVARWWGPVEDDFPQGDYPDGTRLAVLLDGKVIGMVQYEEEADPNARHADVDIFLDARHLGLGYGTDAMKTIVRHLLEDRGHHRVTLWTVPENERAIRCYEKVGFRRVGVTRASQRDTVTGRWVDELLMELVDLHDEERPRTPKRARRSSAC
jgi:aminoglycoside 6'-N-acetyltransferase